jgi:hypothetical protein
MTARAGGARGASLADRSGAGIVVRVRSAVLTTGLAELIAGRRSSIGTAVAAATVSGPGVRARVRSSAGVTSAEGLTVSTRYR